MLRLLVAPSSAVPLAPLRLMTPPVEVMRPGGREDVERPLAVKRLKLCSSSRSCGAAASARVPPRPIARESSDPRCRARSARSGAGSTGLSAPAAARGAWVSSTSTPAPTRLSTPVRRTEPCSSASKNRSLSLLSLPLPSGEVRSGEAVVEAVPVPVLSRSSGSLLMLVTVLALSLSWPASSPPAASSGGTSFCPCCPRAPFQPRQRSRGWRRTSWKPHPHLRPPPPPPRAPLCPLCVGLSR